MARMTRMNLPGTPKPGPAGQIHLMEDQRRMKQQTTHGQGNGNSYGFLYSAQRHAPEYCC